MRAIKFRGKRIDSGEWIYGSLLDGDIIVAGPVDADGEYIGVGEWSSVEPETVGQLTGQRDTEGKDVYAGDVVLDLFTGDYYEVIWDDSGAMFLFANTDTEKGKNGAIDYYEFEDECRGLGFQVVGNVYERPALGRRPS